MKKLIVLFAIILMSGCTIQTEQSYVIDDATKEELIEQLKEELAEDLRIEYQPSLTDVENLIMAVVQNNERAIIGVSNLSRTSTLPPQYQLASTGSGFIYDYDDEGYYYAITNAHVVEEADKISVVLYNEEQVDAVPIYGTQIYVADAESDIGVIKFKYDKEPLKVVEITDSEAVLKGQLAIAIGNPLGYDYFASVTMGVISGLARGVSIDYNNDQVNDWTAKLIQHDAAISPGNSGGPLFDINGRVIGVNNMKIVDSDVSNIGFAIPSNTALEIATILREKGRVQRAALGVIIDQLNLPEGVDRGVMIIQVNEGGSVDGSGIQANDVIIEFDGITINNFNDLSYALDNSYVGDNVVIKVNRNGSILSFNVILKEKTYE